MVNVCTCHNYSITHSHSTHVVMNDTIQALRKFSQQENTISQQQQQQTNTSSHIKSFIDSYIHLFSKESLINDEAYLSALQMALYNNGFIQTSDNKDDEIRIETKRYLQAFIDPTFLINAVKDISQKSIKHFSNIVSSLYYRSIHHILIIFI
jgi:hypothetical protein